MFQFSLFKEEAMFDEFHMSVDARCRFAWLGRTANLLHDDHRLRYYSIKELEKLEKHVSIYG